MFRTITIIAAFMLCGSVVAQQDGANPREKRTILVEGAVENPGHHELDQGKNLIHLIQLVSPLFNARLKEVLVVRGGGKSMTYYMGDVRKLAENKRDWELKDGDRVFIFGESF